MSERPITREEAMRLLAEIAMNRENAMKDRTEAIRIHARWSGRLLWGGWRQRAAHSRACGGLLGTRSDELEDRRDPEFPRGKNLQKFWKIRNLSGTYVATVQWALSSTMRRTRNSPKALAPNLATGQAPV